MRKPSTEELSLVHEELFKLATEALQREATSRRCRRGCSL